MRSRSQAPISVRWAVALALAVGLGGALARSVHGSPAVVDVPTPAIGSAWDVEERPDFAPFNAWARGAAATPDAGALAEGVRLAGRRRLALAALIHTDPARALAAAVPEEVRARLPAPVLAQLETPFSVVGDYTVSCQLRARGGPAVRPIVRSVRFDGHAYAAHVYGRRAGMLSKQRIFLHGIRLDGDAALDENVLNPLPPAAAARDARRARDLSSAATPDARAAGATGAGGGPRVAEAGGALYRFASDAHLREAEASLRALEAHRTAETADADEPTALADPASIPATPDSAYTTGSKRVLVIRVDFSDLPGDPAGYGTTYTQAAVQNVADNQVAPYFARSSAGLTSLSFTVSAKVYRLPRTAAFYASDNGTGNDSGDDEAGLDSLHADARAAVRADYVLANYDRVIVLFSNLSKLSGSGITFGGRGDISGSRIWANGEFDFRIVSHELGHTYGLEHANFWQTSDGNPVSLAGQSVEYGDPFDIMGANYANSQGADFNVWFKTLLGWVAPAQVQTVTASGTYRVYRFDGGGAGAGGALALQIVRDGVRNYWISARRNFPDYYFMTHGVYVTWGYNGDLTDYAERSNLLDAGSYGTDAPNAALPTGRTFTDAAAQISITPVAEGGTAPSQYEDVQIVITTTPPTITSAATASALLRGPFNYQIAASGHPTSYAATGLPPGLSLNPATGLISGAATAAGVFPVTLSATNPFGTGTAPLTLTVPLPPPYLTGLTGAFGRVGAAFSYQITATNAPTGFSAAGLPPGLSVDPDTGLISGTPLAAGQFPVVLGATNAGGTGHITLFLNVAGLAPVFTCATSATGTVGQPFALLATALNASFNFFATVLPPGLRLDSFSGLISGTPTAAGSYPVVLSAGTSNGSGTSSLTLTINAAPTVPANDSFSAAQPLNGAAGSIAGSTSLATREAGEPVHAGGAGLLHSIWYTWTPTVTGPVTFRTQGSSFDTVLAVYTGGGVAGLTPVASDHNSGPVLSSAASFPAQAGTAYAIAVDGVAGSAGAVALQWFSAPAIASGAASGQRGTPFFYQIAATNGPMGFTTTGLPAGLNLDTTSGLIRGTPTTVGVSTVTLGAFNAGGMGSATLALTISAPLPKVAVSVSVPQVTAGGGGTGAVVLDRTGSDLSQDLIVTYTVKGSAVPGVDYAPLQGTVKIKAGRATKTLRIVPLGAGAGPGVKRAVKLAFPASPLYQLSGPESVKIKIVGE